MTKVFISPLLLKYRQEIAGQVSRLVRQKYIAGVQSSNSEEAFPVQADLLPAPRIEYIGLEIYEGRVDDLILLLISDDFGLDNVHIVIKDEHGNVIERGDAFHCLDFPEIWNYLTVASVPSGASVTVHAIVTDRLWGVGALSKDKTIP